MLCGSQLIPSASIVGRSRVLKNIWFVAKLPLAGIHEPFEVATAMLKMEENRAANFFLQNAFVQMHFALSVKAISSYRPPR